MFSTQDDVDAGIPDFYENSGFRLWKCIRKHMFTCWFQVTYRVAGEDMHEIYFMHSVMDVLSFTKLEDVKIIEVYVISPDYLNGSQGWKMERLREILVAEEPLVDGQPAYVYVVDQNTRYVDSEIQTPEKYLINKYQCLL